MKTLATFALFGLAFSFNDRSFLADPQHLHHEHTPEMSNPPKIVESDEFVSLPFLKNIIFSAREKFISTDDEFLDEIQFPVYLDEEEEEVKETEALEDLLLILAAIGNDEENPRDFKNILLRDLMF